MSDINMTDFGQKVPENQRKFEVFNAFKVEFLLRI